MCLACDIRAMIRETTGSSLYALEAAEGDECVYCLVTVMGELLTHVPDHDLDETLSRCVAEIRRRRSEILAFADEHDTHVTH